MGRNLRAGKSSPSSSEKLLNIAPSYKDRRADEMELVIWFELSMQLCLQDCTAARDRKLSFAQCDLRWATSHEMKRGSNVSSWDVNDLGLLVSKMAGLVPRGGITLGPVGLGTSQGRTELGKFHFQRSVVHDTTIHLHAAP